MNMEREMTSTLPVLFEARVDTGEPKGGNL